MLDPPLNWRLDMNTTDRFICIGNAVNNFFAGLLFFTGVIATLILAFGFLGVLLGIVK